MTEPSLAAQATMRELEQLALARMAETGQPAVACAFVNSDQASVSDVDLDAGDTDHETTVALPSVRRLYP